LHPELDGGGPDRVTVFATIAVLPVVTLRLVDLALTRLADLEGAA
jgi:hypothetical protein